MTGKKHLSDVITDISVFKKDKFNIVEAMTSQGKTYFALNSLRKWVSAPEKMLYLIDTSNGEAAITKNGDTVHRTDFAYDNIKMVKDRITEEASHKWGDDPTAPQTGKTPVMTYAGFGSYVRHPKYKDFWKQFEVIVCDEIQNLFNYQKIKGDSQNLQAAERALRKLITDENVLIVAISATPRAAIEGLSKYKPFENCGSYVLYEVPFDKTDLILYENNDTVSITHPKKVIKAEHEKGHRGVIYTQSVREMQNYIDYAKSIGMNASGFWSIHNSENPMEDEHKSLRETVLETEHMPEDLDLLVINAASLTCIKLKWDTAKGEKPIDFMFINTSDEDDQIQARGRVCNDLKTLYLKDDSVPIVLADDAKIPDKYLNRWLSKEERKAMCEELGYIDKKNKRPYRWNTIKKAFEGLGYKFEERHDKIREWIIYPPVDNECD